MNCNEIIKERENGNQNLYYWPLENAIFWSIPEWDFVEEEKGLEWVVKTTHNEKEAKKLINTFLQDCDPIFLTREMLDRGGYPSHYTV